MSALLKRIAKLETANRPQPKPEPLSIIRVVVAPELGVISAICRGQQIERQAGESESLFRERAYGEFNRAFKGPCVESIPLDDDL